MHGSSSYLATPLPLPRGHHHHGRDGGGQDELKDTSGLKFRDNLKILWLDNMSEENKEIVWKYFKVFVLLCEKYVIEQG